MIFGIGTDIVDINRINEIDSLDSFAKKILSKNEKKFFENLKEIHRVKHLAKQFAGKEAIAKAFGTGFTKSIKFRLVNTALNYALMGWLLFRAC